MLQEKPSALKSSHPALQNMKFLNFFIYFRGSFLLSWIRIRIHGSANLIESGSNLDPDLKHWFPETSSWSKPIVTKQNATYSSVKKKKQTKMCKKGGIILPVFAEKCSSFGKGDINIWAS
jgi:hypothetical protein